MRSDVNSRPKVICLLVRVVESSLQAPVFLLQLLGVCLQPAQLLLLALHHGIQLLDVLPVLLFHFFLPIKNLNKQKHRQDSKHGYDQCYARVITAD